jgi:hypothetical protein
MKRRRIRERAQKESRGTYKALDVELGIPRVLGSPCREKGNKCGGNVNPSSLPQCPSRELHEYRKLCLGLMTEYANSTFLIQYKMKSTSSNVVQTEFSQSYLVNGI